MCDQHLNGEHRELHGCFKIITEGKTGYSRHPETLRWMGKAGALKLRHDALVVEMVRRGWTGHTTPIPAELVPTNHSWVQTEYVDDPYQQLLILRDKGCGCRVRWRLRK